MPKDGEIILVTGGSGFLGQHLIKFLLQEQEKLGIKQIRTVDLKPYENRLGHRESEDLISFVGDITKPETIQKAFIGVDCVFHCAAYISIQYPPNFDEFERVNVQGTKNIVDLCLQNNVPRLIYTSSAAVTLVPYMGHSTFVAIINQTESKTPVPMYDPRKSPIEFDNEFLLPGYASSKLRAETVVLNSSGATLESGLGVLQTAAIRAPPTYGEEDHVLMTEMFKYMAKHNNRFPRISGTGGKHQLVYVGNVAWGHICAYKTLKTAPKNIAGLPVYITDDTPINDISRLIQRIGRETETLRFEQSWWSIPHFIFFFLAFIIEMLVKTVLNPLFGIRLKHSLRALCSYTGSIIMYNRLRASIHLDYEPYFDEKKSIMRSAIWYEKWWRDNIGTVTKKRTVTSGDGLKQT